jgi:hypothetical protein
VVADALAEAEDVLKRANVKVDLAARHIAAACIPKMLAEFEEQHAELGRKYAAMRAVASQCNWPSNDVNRVHRLERLFAFDVGLPPAAWRTWFEQLRKDSSAEPPI